MSIDLTIQQCILLRDRGGAGVVAKSEGVSFADEEALLRIAAKFGDRPVGVACPGAVWALPLGKSQVTVGSVADLPGDSLGFRILMLGRPLYDALGDPFAIADRFPANWSARGPLEPLAWPAEPLPRRTVAEVAETLKQGDSPLLLGATQALLDGGRMIVVRSTPDPELLRGLWRLLPDRSRMDIWPASFAFSVEPGFQVAVLPVAPTPWPVGYLTEEQVRDYPEGRYELALQIAAEAGNQAELDHLFARRSSRDTLRLAISMVVFAFLVAGVLKFL